MRNHWTVIKTSGIKKDATVSTIHGLATILDNSRGIVRRVKLVSNGDISTVYVWNILDYFDAETGEWYKVSLTDGQVKRRIAVERAGF